MKPAHIAVIALVMLGSPFLPSSSRADDPTVDQFFGAAVPPERPASGEAVRLLREASLKLRDNGLEAAETLSKAAIADQGFSKLPEDLRHTGYSMLASSAASLGHNDIAFPAVKMATAAPQATGGDWNNRLIIGLRLGDKVDAVASLKALALRFPATLSKIDVALVTQAAGGNLSDPVVEERAYQVMEALYPVWKPADSFQDLSGFWKPFALMRLQRGNLAGARDAARRVTAARLIIEMRADRRFDPIIDPDRESFDPVKAAEARLVLIREKMTSEPNRLDLVNALASTLMSLERLEEAADLLKQAIAKAKPADGSKSPYRDADQVNWSMDARARLLSWQGHFQEADEEMQSAAKLPERGQVNVSQAINAGLLLCRAQKPAEARDILSRLGSTSVSGYGRMEVEVVQACASNQLGDKAQQAKSLAYLKAHLLEAPGPAVDAHLYVNDLDGAAEVVKQILADPNLGVPYLRDRQDYDVPPAASDWSREMGRRLTLVLNRPDVKAAVDKVGRIEKVRLYDVFSDSPAG